MFRCQAVLWHEDVCSSLLRELRSEEEMHLTRSVHETAPRQVEDNTVFRGSSGVDKLRRDAVCIDAFKRDGKREGEPLRVNCCSEWGRVSWKESYKDY